MGAVSHAVGAGFETYVVGGQDAPQRERPVDGLSVAGERPGYGAGLTEQERVGGVHMKRRRGAVPRHREPVRGGVKPSRSVGWVHCQNVVARRHG